MHTAFRFFDGLDDDMVGYVFPQGNESGIPTATNPTASGTDRFGCGHSDDSESVSATAGGSLGAALVSILSEHGARESVQRGHFVLPDGRLSRNPLGLTDTVKCTGPDTTFKATGSAVAMWVPDRGVIRPAGWMDLAGRPQGVPDRNTRGYLETRGVRHWLDGFANVAGQPAQVSLRGSRRQRTAARNRRRTRRSSPSFTG